MEYNTENAEYRKCGYAKISSAFSKIITLNKVPNGLTNDSYYGRIEKICFRLTEKQLESSDITNIIFINTYNTTVSNFIETYNNKRIINYIKLYELGIDVIYVKYIERQCYNLSISISEVSNWISSSFINKYDSIVDDFITKYKINKIHINNNKIDKKYLVSIIGVDNPNYIISYLVPSTMDYNRKVIILKMYYLLDEYLDKNMSLELKLNKCISIEKVIMDKATNKSIKMNDLYNKDNIINKYSFMIGELLNYINKDNNTFSEALINNIVNTEIFDIKNIKPDRINSEQYKKLNDDKEQRENIVIKRKITSAYKCSSCKRNIVEVEAVDTRSLDEGSTLRAKCQFCNHRWNIRA